MKPGAKLMPGLTRLVLGSAEPEDRTTILFMALLGLVLVVTTANRQVLSILARGIEGDGPGYLAYAHYLGEAGLSALSPYWQPGYPFLIALAHGAGVDPFCAGTWINCIAGLLLLPVCYRMARTLFDARVARWSMLLVASSGLLVVSACSVNTDMLHALLFTCSVLPLLKDDGHRPRSVATSGLIAGLAYLVRHQALALVLLPVLRGLAGPSGKRLKSSSLGLAFFFVAASPVLVAYWIQFGNPFHNVLYANIAGAAFFDGNMNLFFHEGHDRQYTSLVQVLGQEPWAVMRLLALNFLDAIRRIVTSLHMLPIGVLGGAGILLFAGRRQAWALAALVLCAASATPAKLEDRYLLAMLPLVMPFAAALGLDIVERRIIRRVPKVTARRLRFWGPTALAVCLLFVAVDAGVEVFRQEDPLFLRAGVALRESAPVNDRGPFMTQGAYHIGYYARMEGLSIGPSTLGDPTRGRPATHEALRERLARHQARYLLFHSRLGHAHPELAHLRDPKMAPPFLKVIHARCRSRIVVYEVQLEQPASGRKGKSP